MRGINYCQNDQWKKKRHRHILLLCLSPTREQKPSELIEEDIEELENKELKKNKIVITFIKNTQKQYKISRNMLQGNGNTETKLGLIIRNEEQNTVN